MLSDAPKPVPSILIVPLGCVTTILGLTEKFVEAVSPLVCPVADMIWKPAGEAGIAKVALQFPVVPLEVTVALVTTLVPSL